MPVTSSKGKVKEDGQEKDALIVNFTNGAKEQLEELRSYFNADTDVGVVKLGISLLQNLKDKEEVKKE